MPDHNFEEFFLNLPDDPEEAFIVFQKKKYSELEDTWQGEGSSSWHYERTYVNAVFAFDEVYELGLFADFHPVPTGDMAFNDYFQSFRAEIDKLVLKFQLEQARRRKAVRGSIVKLDDSTRVAIRALVNALREKLDVLELSEPKRTELVSKLNAFASQVEQNLSRTESFNSFVVDLGRTVGTATKEFKPFTDTINRVLDQLDRAKDWFESLPPWSERKRIEGPPKQLPKPSDFAGDLDDDIPF